MTTEELINAADAAYWTAWCANTAHRLLNSHAFPFRESDYADFAARRAQRAAHYGRMLLIQRDLEHISS